MTTHDATITPKDATGNGDIGGYRVACSCGDVAYWSLRTMADSYARSHADYMNRQGR